jgi:enterochelin esterase-like enzyme
MLRYLILTTLALAGTTTVPAMAATIAAAERLTLQSQVLGEERTVIVSLPASYTRSIQRYPVLYLTDAQWQFDQTRANAVSVHTPDGCAWCPG